MPARYALSYVPPEGTSLADLGRLWLGRDIYSGEMQDQPFVSGLAPERIVELTKWRRLEGFHSVLKPSFQLSAGTTIEGMISTARILANNLEPVEIPQLEINVIGKFIVLAPTVPSPRIAELAAQSVRVLDGYRQPIEMDLNSRFLRDKLTLYQIRMLKHWGYPYVMEEFQFFLPMTDLIEDDKEREILGKALSKLCKPVIGDPFSINALTIIGQENRSQPMRLIETIPFGLQ